jgi:putative DNA primase/helicase
VARRPVILTGIPNTIGRPDLAERAISIELAPLATARQTEAELDAAFIAAMPGLLGLLVDGLSAALRCYESTHVENLPRMADACRWAEAGALGLGIEPGRIAEAWRANRIASDADVVESDEVTGAVRTLLAAWPEPIIKGSPAELAALLADQVSESVRKGPFWPKTASAMGTHLRRIAPALRVAWGIAITSGKGGADSSRWWEVRRL